MFYSFKEGDSWPSKDLILNNLPDVFRSKYASTRVIIDATEFLIDKPSNPDVQAATWSSYKNRHTLKVLVGCTPNGALSILSPVYDGRISDKDLTKRSGLLRKLEEGDVIMADRGFDVQDDLPDGVELNMPPFLGGRSQLTTEEVLKTRGIATLRSHVD